MKTQYDKSIKALFLNQGSMVLLRNEAAKKQENNWFGPYFVKEVHRKGLVTLCDPRGIELNTKVYKDRLKLANLDPAQNTTYACLKKNG